MYCFIVNKVSGNGKAVKVWNKIEEILKEKNVFYCVHFTQRSKHATALVQKLIREEVATAIIAVGGDGTIHEVINGLVGSNIPLGVIPAGSGNDFSRGIGIPIKTERALERILSRKPKKIDLGHVNSTYFCTVAGVGFDAEVARRTNISMHKKTLNFFKLGKISYSIIALSLLFRYKPRDISFMVDNKFYKIPNVWLIAVANLPCYGGGLFICPDAKSDDGLFDICIVQGLSRWEFLKVFPSVLKGTHTSSPFIQLIKGKELEVYSPTPLRIHGDGEIIGQTPARIKIEPHSLYVI